MKRILPPQFEAATHLIKKFNSEEMKTCLEAGMNLNKEDSLTALEEAFFNTLKSDFGVIGNIMNGSQEHLLLLNKFTTLTVSDRELLCLLCHQFWHGDENTIHAIGESLNEHCQSIDLYSNNGKTSQNKISSLMDITLDFKTFISAICNDVDCSDDYVMFSIPPSANNSTIYIEILEKMLNKLGFHVLSDSIDRQLNHLIDTDLPINIYFSLMTDEAA